MAFRCQNAAHPAPVLFVCPSSVDEGRLRCIPQIMEVPEESRCVSHQDKAEQKEKLGGYHLQSYIARSVEIVVKVQNLILTSIAEISEKGSMFFLVGSFEALVPALGPELILADAESLGGGGSGDRSFPVAPGGGARSMLALGFSVAPPDKPAEESMPLPVDGLFFTFILMVSPSYNSRDSIIKRSGTDIQP